MATEAELAAAEARALRNKKISVDGLSTEGPTLDELRRYKASSDAGAAIAALQRPVLYQRMYSPSKGSG